MRNLLYSAVALASLSTICSAQTITETFGSGANEFYMEFVTIGNPNNAADTTGEPNPAGSVAYTYNLGKHEVSRDMITKANSAGSLGITMSYMSGYGPDANGGPGYADGVNKPATGITWYEAAKFVNWLNTSKGYQAAYKFVGGTFQTWSPTDAGYNANNLFRNNQAKYVITSTDEWYKGAYGNLDGTWNDYPTGSDSRPKAVARGTDTNTAVYGQSASTGPADITNAGGLSPWGTMAQGGNVWERMETAHDGRNNMADESRVVRGGSWILDHVSIDNLILQGWFAIPSDPSDERDDYGFRIVTVPEPSSLSLLALGGVVVALRRRR